MATSNGGRWSGRRGQRHGTRGIGCSLLIAALSCSKAAHERQPLLVPQAVGTTVRLQAVSVLDSATAWVSGLQGTFARTVDGGATWGVGRVPGADSLEFRDVHAIDQVTAYLLSAGPGDRSRIYKTVDAGATWSLQFVSGDSAAFFDCFAFWDARSGLAVSDAVEGRFLVVVTRDGEHWEALPDSVLPPALPGEAGFAASGTCLVTGDDSTAWFATGGASPARVFRTSDRGGTWSVQPTPITGGPGAGVMSLTFFDGHRGVAAGGGIGKPDGFGPNVAVTTDGGRSWSPGGRAAFPGAVYGVSVVPGLPAPTAVAVGPGGASYTSDGGATWLMLDSLDYWGLGFASGGVGWIVGPEGRITKVIFSGAATGR